MGRVAPRAEPVQQPPDARVDETFPARPIDGIVFRATRHPPGWFASAARDAEEGGRFDLEAPRGTLYSGISMATAVREGAGARLLASGQVPASVASEVHVWQLTVGGPLRVADLAHDDAADRGVSRELSAGNDYAMARTWAARIDELGFDGIGYLSRFTSGSSASGAAVAAFGHAGAHLGPFTDPVDRGTIADLATALRLTVAPPKSAVRPPRTIRMP
jgi:hypothetical protein